VLSPTNPDRPIRQLGAVVLRSPQRVRASGLAGVGKRARQNEDVSGTAGNAEDVQRQAAAARTLDELTAQSTTCRACPRLVSWREDVARVKRRSFADEPYWGRPVPGWGDPNARIVIVGLAPAAHGGNRTGRVFTGDRSGDWLFAALYRVGLAAKPTSVRADDGQRLIGVRMVAAVRCAPPANKPTTDERDTCRPWLVRELELLAPTLKVLVVLGGFGWQALLPNLAAAGYALPRPLPRFGHGVRVDLSDDAGRRTSATADRQPLSLLGCYHPSQQNTFTGKLTEGMLDDVLELAKTLAPIGS
jgi:uracil-DNA glycosylase family 4